MLGLGLMAGAVLSSTAFAQVRDTSRTKRDTARGPGDTVTVRRDTTAKRDRTREIRVPVPAREDSLLKRDSILRRDSARAVPKDTIKAPFTAAEAPVLADPTGSFVWDRRDMYSTGALTVQELLDRVPGVTTFRSSWISQPMAATFFGAPGRVRVFLDGLELEELDPRMDHSWDLTQIPLWALDDVRVERGASEIRIYMRSWRVDRTTPYTRTDIYSGDLNTNLYRGYFGRRYEHGEGIQFAAQQFGTNPGRQVASSDQLGVLARVGIARSNWSTDAVVLRDDRQRGLAVAELTSDSIPETASTRTDAYLRAGWGNTNRGPWVQGLASGSRYSFGGQKNSSGSSTTTDTSLFRSQYVLSAGYAMGAWRASFTQRYRAGLLRRVATPSARLGLETKTIAASVLAEGRGLDSTRRFEASVVVRPLSVVFLGGAFGSNRSKVDSAPSRGETFARAEAGLRIRDFWVSAGVLHGDAVPLAALRILHRATADTVGDASQGVFATVRGRIWKAIYADAQAIQWNDTGSFYRPKYQTRSELYLSTSLLDRFPSGNLHILASIAHEYRSSILWPDSAGVVRIRGYRVISTLLQFRILSAEVFYNFRNVLLEQYRQTPGFQLPRQVQLYGVRWEFWN